jgi:hypothetical protein
MATVVTANDENSGLYPFELALKRARQREDSHNAQTLYFPSGYDRDLYITLAENVGANIDRLKVCSTESISATSFECTVWRDLASTGVKIRVIYLISHFGLLKSALSERIRLDIEAGLQVRIIAAHDLPDPIAELQLGDTLIVDGHLATYRNWVHDLTRDELGLWTVSTSKKHVDQFSRTFLDVWTIAMDPRQMPPRLDLEEPLVQSAPILAQVAPVLCRGDHIDSSGCDWYHGTWQFLRLMDLVSTPVWHHQFYAGSLEKAVAQGARHILITGTADYSVFAYVLEAVRTLPDSTVTVVDLCQTPLFACQWYAKQCDFDRLNLVSDDVLSFFAKRQDPFDIIITDAFLTRFPKSSASAVAEGWRSVLKPGGRVITTVRVHAESESGQTTEEAVAGFRARAQTRWRRWAPFIDARAVEIADRAEIYARRMISRPIGTQSEIMELLSNHFSIEEYELAGVPGELYPTKYMRVILTR